MDLQGPNGILMNGWQAAELIGYDQGMGFGWDDPTDVRSIFVEGPSGIPNPLNEDAHYGRSPGTFKIAVPNGTYCVGIGLDGGTSGSRGLPEIDKVDVTIEGELRFDDVGRLGSLSLRYDDVNVADGVLEITIADDGGSTNHWSIFAIEVDPDLSKNAACLQ